MPDSPSLQLITLGGLQVELNGRPLSGFVSTKVQALLIYLALTVRPQPREKLIGLLWADMPDADAKTNLRQALSNLRKLVPDHVSIERDTAAFKPDSTRLLDVHCFEDHLKADRLEAAIEVYHGDFLDGFAVRDAPEFEEWVLAQREHWRELALQALHTLTQRALQAGRYADGIEAARRMLAIDAWREEAHRLLMLLLARSGQFSAALAQYATCRRVMQAEFKTEPAAETMRLYERIRAAMTRVRGNLADHTPPAALIGRERELDEIQHRLREPACRLLTLLGLGGSGKTRLALAAAQALEPAFLYGVYFVPLTTAHSLPALCATIAEALGYALPASQAATALLNYLRSKELLLVLDNFEHLIEQADCVRLVADLVRQAPDLKVMVTSRERLNVQPEWLLDVPGLTTIEAATLFTQAALRTSTPLTADDHAAITRVCRSVYGLPLGIELAAAWTRSMSCTEIAAELERSATSLVSPLRDAPERHRSLQAVFEHSWQLLTAEGQLALAALSIFRGGFTREAAQAVAGASPAIWPGLINQSLVQRLPSGRFDLHELVRQFAADKVTAIDAIRDRHCDYYADFLAAREGALRDERQTRTAIEINAEIDNVRLMWRHAVAQGRSDIFARAMTGVFWMFDAHGRQREGVELLSTAAAALKHDATRTRLYSQLLTRQASFHTMLGEFKLAGELCREAEALSISSGDVANEAFAVRFLGYFAMVGGDLPTAQALMTRCLELFRRSGDTSGRCDALNSLALVLNNLGEYDRARACLLEAVELATATHDEMSRSVALSNLGSNAYYLRHFEAARDYFQASYDIDAAINDRRRMAINQHNLACVACDLQDWPQALDRQQAALALFTDMAHAEGAMHCRQNLARIQLGLNDLPEARRHLTEAFQIARQIGAVRDSFEAAVIGAELLRREGRFERAATVIGGVLNSSAATAAVKEDALAVLAKLDPASADSAAAQSGNASLADIAALILQP